MFSRRPDIAKLARDKDEAGLVKALRHRDAEIRAEAARALWGWAGPEAVEPLTTALHDPEVTVRYAALKPLVGLGEVDAVIGALGDEDAGVRTEAAYCLGRNRSPRAVEPLADVLKRDPAEGVRLEAVNALAEFDAEVAVEPIALALHDHAEAVRLEAVRRLGKADFKPRSVEHLATALGDKHSSVRELALAMLQRLDALTDDVWAGVLASGASKQARSWAIEKLGELGGRGAVEPLARALEDADPAVHGAAAAALSRLDDAGIAEAREARVQAGERPPPPVTPPNLRRPSPPSDPEWVPSRMKGHKPTYATIDQGDTAMSQSRCECGEAGAIGDTASGQRQWHRAHKQRVLYMWRGETFAEPPSVQNPRGRPSPPAPQSEEARARLAGLVAAALPSDEVILGAELPDQGLFHLDVLRRRGPDRATQGAGGQAPQLQGSRRHAPHLAPHRADHRGGRARTAGRVAGLAIARHQAAQPLTPLGQTAVDLRVRPPAEPADLLVRVALGLEDDRQPLVGLQRRERGAGLGDALAALGVLGGVGGIGEQRVQAVGGPVPLAGAAHGHRLVLGHDDHPGDQPARVDGRRLGEQDQRRALQGVVRIVRGERVAPGDPPQRRAVPAQELDGGGCTVHARSKPNPPSDAPRAGILGPRWPPA